MSMSVTAYSQGPRTAGADGAKAAAGQTASSRPAPGRVLQRECACGKNTAGGGACGACGVEDKALRRRAEGRPRETSDVPASVHEVLSSAGSPLDGATRALFESRLGHDFSRVRVHTGPGASASARAVAASAYTVGNDIVFAEGRYRPGTADGLSLMAHELTHVVQQSGGGAADDAGAEAHDEAEAARVAEGFSRGRAVRPARRGGPALRRNGEGDAQPSAGTPNYAAQAAEAEFACNIMALCRLQRVAPETVTPARVSAAMRLCHPSASSLSLSQPCLFPGPAMLPGFPTPGTPEGPARGPGVPVGPRAGQPSAGGGAPSSPSLSLPFPTSFSFNLGAARFNVELPTSVAATLPVRLRGFGRITFSLNADVPSQFSFSITLDAVPHVLIIARAGVSPTDRRATAGLEVQSRGTVCRATDEAAARSQLQAAGTRLRDAINALGTPPARTPGQGAAAAYVADARRYGEVVAAIANVHSTVESVRAACRQVPTFSVGLGARIPFTPTTPSTPPTSRDLEGSPYLGITGTFRF